MEFFWLYLRSRRKALLAFSVGAVLLGVSFALYHLPMKAVLYPCALCAGVCLLVLAWDFVQTRHRHDTLTRLEKRTLEELERLPVPESPLEADFGRIIAAARQHRLEQNRLSAEKYENTVAYYTTWAHQIKTPIASMRLHLQNEDTPLSRQLLLDLGRIEQYADMVMTFLRLDSPSTDYVIREYELDGIVRGAVRKFAGEFISRSLRLEYEPLHVKVLTDEKWLSFVVEQVLSNALKYTPAGSIRIYLEQPATLCIRDTGMGISPEDLPRIFENGYTGTGGRLDKRASGIGLYLCRRICGSLGHTISARSRVGEGTTIRVDLSSKKVEIE